MTEDSKPEHEQVLEQLTEQAQRLEWLQQHLREIEQERNRLQSITIELNQKIQAYEQARYDWDWFFEHSLEMLCIAGHDGYFKRVNPSFCETLGYDSDTLLATPIVSFVHPDDVNRTTLEIERLVSGQNSVNFENRYKDGNGQWRWLSWRCPATASSTQQFYAIARDVTLEKLKEKDMLYRAQHDQLTGLLNQAAFEQTLEQAVGRVNRGLLGQIVLFLFDLDHFKPVNDQYGHAAGDAVLKELGRRLRKVKRHHEHVARVGGDEFAWLTEQPQMNPTSDIAIDEQAKRLLETVIKPIHWDQLELRVGCSIGIAAYPQQAKGAEELMRQADMALYSAKRNGRGTFTNSRAKI